MLGVAIFLFTDGIEKLWDSAWKTMIFLGFVYFIYLFARIHNHERKLLSLYKKRDNKIAEIKTKTISQGLMDGMTRQEELNFQKEISPVERQRKYDLEKIPFLKN